MRMKTGDFLLNYSDDERQVYILGLSGHIDFSHIIDLFFKQLIGADFVLNNYLTPVYTQNLMRRLQGLLKDDLVPPSLHQRPKFHMKMLTCSHLYFIHCL